MEKPEVRIAVRNLVEFILRTGDLDMTGIVSSRRLQEGTRIHRKLQKEAGEGYNAEVRLSHRIEYDAYTLVVEGIADGIFETEDGINIDEIKTVTTPLEQIDEDYNTLHWAQAKCYAYIHAVQSELESIFIRLTYYNMDTGKVKYLTRKFSLAELEGFFTELIGKYSAWAEFSVKHRNERDKSIKELSFPFRNYRKGQKVLASAVYRTIRDKKKIFAQAPTGTGKTISAMFPSIKAMGEGLGDKVFYLTAKTVTRQVAEKAVLLMQEKGLTVKTITLTSKDKICANQGGICSPDSCPYAKGHYDRVNEAILDILNSETVITRDILAAYSQKHMVCPFEYSLDIALWLDLIICDYNYVFDPRAYLRRFFEYGGDYILLVDEAHNLVDRAREMFSAGLDKRSFMELRRQVKAEAHGVYAAMTSINKYFIELRKSFEKTFETRVIEPPSQLFQLVEDFIREFDSCLSGGNGMKISEELLELYFNCLSFIAVYKLYDERYITYTVREGNEVGLKLFCVDPSYLLSKACDKVRSSIFFSATLLPLNYFRDILGGSEDDYTMRLVSPFERNRLCLAAADNISTKYKDREDSYALVAEYVKAAVSRKTGNYFVFFPSFEYMNKVHSLYVEAWPGDRVILQNNSMSEDEREQFLQMFEEDPQISLVAFAVMGGIFSEGIDLAGDRLSGAVVVGVGLPQVCAERDIICSYFREKNGLGFEYAYMFPGMNRVLQAAGRVIRTEQDKGFVLLLDERFVQRRYLELFPTEWSGYLRVSSTEAAGRAVEEFWKQW